MSAERRSPLRLSPLVLLLLAPFGCGPGEAPAAPPDAAYSVRGEIAKLPTAESGEVWIRHEAIPDFRNDRGETVGMESMTMPFPLGSGVALGDLAAGDRVAFDFEVRWSGRGRPLAITRIERLPPGTRLAFDPAEPEGAADDPGPTGQEAGSIPK